MDENMIEVNDFAAHLKDCACEHLFDDECYSRIENVQRQFGLLMSHYVIWETVLSHKDMTVDCSILHPYHTVYGKNYGIELDYEACREENIIPCFGMNISKVTDIRSLFSAARKILPRIIPKEVIIALWPQLERIAGMAFDWGGGVSDVAYMEGRTADAKLKMYLQYLTPKAVLSILKELEWDGDLLALENLLNEYVPYCKAERFMIDFNVDQHGISSKVNVCISLKDQQKETVAAFLSHLIDNGLCLPEKASDVIKFIKAGSPHIQNHITQFKLPFAGDRVMMAKVYLGQKTK